MSVTMDRRTFINGWSIVAAAGLAGMADRSLAAETEAAYTGELPETWDAEADVVVVGSGAAGVAAAWFALDGGLTVSLLEQMEDLGGSAIENAGQISFGATNVQKRLGYNTTPEQFKSWLKYVGTEGVPDELLDLYVYQGADVIDWLESIGVEFGETAEEDNPLVYVNEDGTLDMASLEANAINSLGVEFHPKYIAGWQGAPEPICHMARFPEWTDEIRHYREDSMAAFAMDARHGGPAYMLPIIDGIRAMNGDIHTSTRAVKGYKDESGRVCGVMAEGPDGKIMNFKANKAVVIAGGNWLSDAGLAERYGGHIAQCGLFPFTVSDGGVAERIGLDMGGHIVNGDAYWLTTDSSFFLFPFIVSRTSAFSKAIIVDHRGMRFVTEDTYTPLTTYEMATRKQIDPPDAQYWVILPDEYYKAHIDYLNQRVIVGYAGTPLEWKGRNADEVMDANEADFTTMVHADTIEELAEALGTPFLPMQIEMYNRMAEAGEDTQLGRFPENLVPFDEAHGPFHAAPIKMDYWGGYSSGGLDINVHGQVLDDDQQPIPGLYAAGRSARSIAEGVHHPSTGMSCAQGMLMGRVIGRYLAAGEPVDEEGSAPAADAPLADGTYEASSKGIGGNVPVTVTIEDGVIAGVEVGENAETQGIGSKAIEQLPALIVEANGTEGVDAVSGATVTSKAIFAAVEDCLAQARA